MLKRSCVLAGAQMLVLLTMGCSSKDAADSPVAAASLSVSRDHVAIGSPVKLTYRFEVTPTAAFDADYWVFVHILEPDGERLWTDDHLPPIPTSTWKPGQKVEYSRTVFVPNYPYIGPAVIRLGLYNPANNKRLTLSGAEASRKEYEVAKFDLQPQSENIFLIYKDGWHPAEVSSDDPGTEWQWTKKTASVSFRNPKKDGSIYVEYAARIDKFSTPQQVTVRLGGQAIGAFMASSKDKTLATLPMTASQLGSADVAELSFDVDQTFTPGGSDTRELGIQVFHVFIDAK